ncbi:hypothetical protein TNIN_321581 [Trichonephila inaurata madagascariensis]|uniref:Uncharacterized protein n=1 Tax=Trichonephila inaurata madagascariensis TaxID=2747483 RepID=A0A8X7CKH4_9ARAC|nr:hypothetical protein TNIN_321581 [Trichonephila inaurata madagascariensis]
MSGNWVEFGDRSTPWTITQIQDSIPPRLAGNTVIEIFLGTDFDRSFNKIFNGVERHKTRNFLQDKNTFFSQKSAFSLPGAPQEQKHTEGQ